MQSNHIGAKLFRQPVFVGHLLRLRRSEVPSGREGLALELLAHRLHWLTNWCERALSRYISACPLYMPGRLGVIPCQHVILSG